jgi:hypothetical protein
MQDAADRVERLPIRPNRNGPVTNLYNASHGCLLAAALLRGAVKNVKVLLAPIIP